MSAANKTTLGFTIPELMTALAVTGLALALAVPSMDNIIANQQRASSVNLLVSSLHLARSAAMTRNEVITLCTSSTGKQCTDTPWAAGWIVVSEQARQQAAEADGILAAEPALADSITVESAAFGRMISYRPNGQTMTAQGANETGQFLICSNRGSTDGRGLWINASGIPKLVDRQANGTAIHCAG